MIKTVAVIGASGNFGTPITSALREAGFRVTIISRPSSDTLHAPGIPVIRPEYSVPALAEALVGQDAVVCVVGPGGVPLQETFVQAAYEAGVKRFIIDDFGWGPNPKTFSEFDSIHAVRKKGWDFAAQKAEEGLRAPDFSWTGITTGNPIDWALRKFPLMGFDVSTKAATIYDDGTESFTGTTLEGIGQAVVGVLQHPVETANRFVKVRSIMTCQNELLSAFQQTTAAPWTVTTRATEELKQSGLTKHQSGTSGWVLELVVAQLFDKGEARCVVAPTRAESDADLLGVREESARDVVRKVMTAI